MRQIGRVAGLLPCAQRRRILPLQSVLSAEPVIPILTALRAGTKRWRPHEMNAAYDGQAIPIAPGQSSPLSRLPGRGGACLR